MSVEHKYLLCREVADRNPGLPVRVLTTDTKYVGINAKRVDPMEINRSLIADSRSIAGETWILVAQGWEEHLREIHCKHAAKLYFSMDTAVRRGIPNGMSPCGISTEELEEIDLEGLDNKLRNAVIYDHHHLFVKSFEKFIGGVLFYEYYEATSEQRPLFENSEPKNKRALEAEFLAAGIARIMVLDERVQDEIENHPSVKVGRHPIDIDMHTAVKLRRIYVPSRTICELRQSPTRKSIEAYLQQVCSRKENGSDPNYDSLDFVVVHQGILDRLSSSENGENDAISWIKRTTHEIGAELVICSGRGVPPQVRDAGVRFVPLSSVLRWVVHHPSKFHLYDLLCASRRPCNA